MSSDRPRRDPKLVGDLIEEVLGRIARADVAPMVRLHRQWDETAGRWADKCRPVALGDGVLTVEVGNGMDASMLRYDAETLLGAVQQVVGEELPVKRLVIKVAGGRDPAR